MKNWITIFDKKLSDSLKNYTPALWFPLTIVLFNGIVHIFNTQTLYAQIEFSEIPRNIQIAISVLGSFSVIVGGLISWLLMSVVIFYWCELFFDADCIFRNFFEIVGICHLILLAGTLICSLFILFVLPSPIGTLEYNIRDSQEMVDAITETLSPLRLIGAVGNICFGLIIVIVIRGFFEITWLKAFCSVVIPYVIYWLLSKALQSVFLF
ncbi:hypothetical protein F4X10_23455 [Candidatus Poribacteria bacterium]|nr:hypothetical protein [Candidatus Poribacteria bacterium]